MNFETIRDNYEAALTACEELAPLGHAYFDAQAAQNTLALRILGPRLQSLVDKSALVDDLWQVAAYLVSNMPRLAKDLPLAVSMIELDEERQSRASSAATAQPSNPREWHQKTCEYRQRQLDFVYQVVTTLDPETT